MNELQEQVISLGRSYYELYEQFRQLKLELSLLQMKYKSVFILSLVLFGLLIFSFFLILEG